eukprot:scaffold650583_cov25-Prasinocladus_malaysianus.AAC.1
MKAFNKVSFASSLVIAIAASTRSNAGCLSLRAEAIVRILSSSFPAQRAGGPQTQAGAHLI